MSDDPIEKIVVLGGGSAGWMAACYLSQAVPGARIELVEAPGIGRIGVGEATVPNLQRVFFDYLGIDERTWMSRCNGSYKMAVKFVNWTTPGTPQAQPRTRADGYADVFYHPFGILPTHDNLPLSHYWLERWRRGETDLRYDQACFVESALMDANAAPRTWDGERAANYAWHFDAQMMADFLQEWATRSGRVKHTLAQMTGVRRDSRGYITALVTDHAGDVEGDLFIDCSGFRGALINQVLGEPFIDQRDYLLCDSAVARQVAHDDEDGIEPYTSSFAMDAGWTWKTPLAGRFGTGYVYSSRYVDDDAALLDFCRLWGLDPTEPVNRIRFRVGRNRRSWVKNCVSIGLASCFLEPLESSGLYFTYAAIYQLAKHFPSKGNEEVLRNSFNQEIAKMFDDTRDFVQTHFYYSPRNDTEFWRANKNLVLSDDLVDRMQRYLAGLPVNVPVAGEDDYYGNFEAEFGNFWTNGSYYAILAGLGLLPERGLPRLAHTLATGRADSAVSFERIATKRAELLGTLPPMHEYLRRLHQPAKDVSAPHG